MLHSFWAFYFDCCVAFLLTVPLSHILERKPNAEQLHSGWQVVLHAQLLVTSVCCVGAGINPNFLLYL